MRIRSHQELIEHYFLSLKGREGALHLLLLLLRGRPGRVRGRVGLGGRLGCECAAEMRPAVEGERS